MICDYGCGQKAVYQFKNGNWCCSKSSNNCPEMIKKRTGKKRSEESKQKMSESHIGQTPWNKNKINIYSEETKSKMGTIRFDSDNPFYGKTHSIEAKKKMSDSAKDRISPMLGKTHSIEAKKKMSESSKNRIMSQEELIRRRKGINYYKKNYPTFSKIEKIRYNPDKPGGKEIQVHCKNHNCENSKEKGGWFTPTYNELSQRIRAIEDPRGNQAGYFYCSNKCKKECILFNKKISQLIKQDKINAGIIEDPLYTSTEILVYNKEVLNRSNNLCEYCGSLATEVHHSRPQKLDPGFALDPDYGIACCEKCHYKYGHKTGTECSTGNLASTICK